MQKNVVDLRCSLILVAIGARNASANTENVNFTGVLACNDTTPCGWQQHVYSHGHVRLQPHYRDVRRLFIPNPHWHD